MSKKGDKAVEKLIKMARQGKKIPRSTKSLMSLYKLHAGNEFAQDLAEKNAAELRLAVAELEGRE